MMVKDTAGSEFNAATNGKANLGVTLGAIGTGLGLMNSGLLNSTEKAFTFMEHYQPKMPKILKEKLEKNK